MDKSVNSYKKIRPTYENFTTKLHDLISQLIRSKKIDLFKIESRTKEISSFEEKIEREDKNYDDPLNEVTDLSGIRIITYYEKDVNKVCELLRSEFKIDEKNSVEKRQDLEEDRFGYISTHLVVNLNKGRKELLEWKQFSEFCSEIQVRSVLQHAWAAIDHKLRYKTKESVPIYLKRKLFRLSALLELADDEFTSIKEISDKKKKKIKKELDSGKMDIKIDLDSIETYLNSSKIFKDFLRKIQEFGFKIDKSKGGKAGINFLAIVSKKLNYDTLKDFDLLISKFLKKELHILRTIGDMISSNKKSKHKKLSKAGILRLIMIINIRNDRPRARKFLEKHPYKKELNQIFLNIIN